MKLRTIFFVMLLLSSVCLQASQAQAPKSHEKIFCRRIAEFMKRRMTSTTLTQAREKAIEALQEKTGNIKPIRVNFAPCVAEYWLLKYEEKSKKYRQISRELRKLKARKQREQAIISSLDIGKFTKLAQAKKDGADKD